MFCIDNIKPNDISKIEEILDQAFGIDRHSKAVYSLRAGVVALSELSFAIRREGTIIASLQFWPVVIRDRQADHDALLLGPIAVRQAWRGQGIGLMLMDHGLNRAKELGHSRVILVGDESYYQKVGFCRRLAIGLDMPGPVDERRLLAQELVPGAMDGVKGMISRIK